jgi:TRAP-type C4-dicarboxylate transport system permease small subunit
MRKIIDYTIKRIGLLVGVLFITLFLLNILNISLRYFWGMSWLWIPDFSRLIFIWAVFLGASILYARKEHLEMDFFINKMNESTREKLSLFIDLGMTIFLVILIFEGYKVSIIRMRIPFDMWDIPTGYAYAAVPVCSIIMLITTINKLINDFIKRRRT